MMIQEASEYFTKGGICSQVPRQLNYEENTSTDEEYRKTGEYYTEAPDTQQEM